MKERNALQRFLVGKNPKTKAAILTYLERYPDTTISSVALEYGISGSTLGGNLKQLRHKGIVDIEPAKASTDHTQKQCVVCKKVFLDEKVMYKITKEFESPYSHYLSFEYLVVGYICSDCGLKFGLKHQVLRNRVTPEFKEKFGIKEFLE